MKVIIKTVNGEEFTIKGTTLANLYSFFTQAEGAFETKPLGWVGDGETFINFAHVISIQFFGMEESK